MLGQMEAMPCDDVRRFCRNLIAVVRSIPWAWLLAYVLYLWHSDRAAEPLGSGS